jgi:hypothetical protein
MATRAGLSGKPRTSMIAASLGHGGMKRVPSSY